NAARGRSDMALSANPCALAAPCHRAADGRYLACAFVADRHEHQNCLLCPFIPVYDVDVGAADGRLAHADENVVGTQLRVGDLLQPDARFPLRLDERPHRMTPSSRPTLAKAASARSRCARSSAAWIVVRL